MARLWAVMGYAILVAFLLASPPTNLFAQEVQSAKITSVNFLERIYDGGNQTITMKVENKGLVTSKAQGIFFMRLWSDDLLIYDESGQYWSVDKGSATTHKILLENMRGPKTYTVRLELYWHNQSDVLVDSTSIVFKVVRLFVDGWSFSQITVTRGAESPALLNITFRNGGNDAMTNVEIGQAGTPALNLGPPSTKQLEELLPGQTATFLVPVQAPADVDLGVQIIKFQIVYEDFAGSKHMEYANATIVVVRMRLGISLELPEEAEYGGILKLSARLADQSGKPLAGERLNFYLASKLIGTAETNESGIATLEHPIDLDTGSYKVGVLYDGSKQYDPAEAASYIKIGPAQTHLLINAPQTVKVAKATVFNATLSDRFGVPLANRQISFYVNGSLIGTTETNRVGQANIQYTPVSQGSLEVEAIFSGDTNHASRSEATRVLVAPLATVLKLKYPSIILGASKFIIEAHLLDESSLPIPQAEIEFYRIEGSQTQSLGTALTDYAGKASLEYSADLSRSNLVQAVYAGDTLYSSTAATASLFVIGQAFIGALVGVVLAGSGAALALAMRFRHKLHGLFSWRRGRRHQVQKVVPQKTLPKVKPIPIEGLGHSESMPPQKQSDEVESRVLRYIIDHGGVISRTRAAEYLGISEEELVAATERLKRLGKLA